MTDHPHDKTGGAAFPTTMNDAVSGYYAAGMTLRDWFAGQAIPYAATMWPDLNAADIERLFGKECGVVHPPKMIAALSYELSDAFLAERERGK